MCFEWEGESQKSVRGRCVTDSPFPVQVSGLYPNKHGIGPLLSCLLFVSTSLLHVYICVCVCVSVFKCVHSSCQVHLGQAIIFWP